MRIRPAAYEVANIHGTGVHLDTSSKQQPTCFSTSLAPSSILELTISATCGVCSATLAAAPSMLADTSAAACAAPSLSQGMSATSLRT